MAKEDIQLSVTNKEVPQEASVQKPTQDFQQETGLVMPTPSTEKNVIEIGTIEALLGICVILIAMGVAWGTLKTLVSGMKKTLDEEMKPDLKNVRERFSVVEDRVDSLWKDKYAPASSPRRLNERGNDILNNSGIKDIVDNNKPRLLEAVRAKSVTNAYDAERAVFSVMANLPKVCPEVIDDLKQGAFSTGADLDAVLLVGGVYLRDEIFSDLGFALDDLDRPTPSSSVSSSPSPSPSPSEES